MMQSMVSDQSRAVYHVLFSDQSTKSQNPNKDSRSCVSEVSFKSTALGSFIKMLCVVIIKDQTLLFSKSCVNDQISASLLIIHPYLLKGHLEKHVGAIRSRPPDHIDIILLLMSW